LALGKGGKGKRARETRWSGLSNRRETRKREGTRGGTLFCGRFTGSEKRSRIESNGGGGQTGPGSGKGDGVGRGVNFYAGQRG